MNTIVTVRDVIEKNNCCGIKTIMITSQGNDEITFSKFIMSNDFRSPEEKLILSSVEPDDQVLVRYTDSFIGPNIVGEFYALTNITGYRRHSCRCGTLLFSDGQIVMCPNENCGLSLLARLDRLSKTPFFMMEGEGGFPVIVKNKSDGWDAGWDISIFKHDPSFVCPFECILDHRFWNTFRNNVENVIFENQNTVSLATFLVEDQFRNFIDSHITIPYTPEHPYNAVGMEHGNNFEIKWEWFSKFYETMYTITHRRDYNCKKQNYFLYQFIYCLGLESLTPMTVEALISYEMIEGFVGIEPLLIYLNALTSRNILTKQLGVHELQANLIVNEFYKRRFEFHDVFAAYCNPSDVASILNSNNIIKTSICI